MYLINERALLERQARRHRHVLRACLGVIALLLALLAALNGSWPGLSAMAAIGASALGLMAVQHLIFRRLAGMGRPGLWG